MKGPGPGRLVPPHGAGGGPRRTLTRAEWPGAAGADV